MRSVNPVFRKANNYDYANVNSDYRSATYLGVGLKVLYFLVITIIGAIGGLYLLNYRTNIYVSALFISIIFGGISAFLAMIKPSLSLIFGSIYSLMEGLLLGTVSWIAELAIPGIVPTVVVSTVAVVLVCALMFVTGLIKINSKFLKFMSMLMIGFLVTILMLWILKLIGVFDYTNYLGLTLLISGISVLIASICLISDMNDAYRLVSSNGPKELEWMISFGIAYCVLWIYIEMLRIVVLIIDLTRR